MGFLFYNMKKEGKGVEKEDLEKRRFFIFFDVLFRKFLKFVQLNFFYILASIPVLAIMFYISPLSVNALKTIDVSGVGQWVAALDEKAMFELDVLLRFMFSFSVIILWGAGPASAGAEYVMRNFSAEEHAWVISDLFEHFKKNLKNGIIVAVVDIIVVLVVPTVLNFYNVMYSNTGNPVFMIAFGVVIVALAVYTMMHFYMYQIMVSFEGGVRSIYKNSFIYAIIRFPQNILIAIIPIVLFIGLYVLMHMFALVLTLFILVALCRFIIIFYTAEVVRNTAISEIK